MTQTTNEGLFGVIKRGEKFEITYAWNGHNCGLIFGSEIATLVANYMNDKTS